MKWKTSPPDTTTSEAGKIQDSLTNCGSNLKPHQFLSLHYERAREHIWSSIKKLSTQTWANKHSAPDKRTSNLVKWKPCWGIESSIAQSPLGRAATYIKARSGALEIPAAGLNCKSCYTGEPSINHILWECKNTQHEKLLFLSELKKISISQAKEVNSLLCKSKQSTTEYILGSGRAVADYRLRPYGTRSKRSPSYSSIKWTPK